MKEKQKPVRKRFPKMARRAQILGAAFSEFAANGYAGTRLDDVARRANVAKGTVFLHFPDKKALFRAVVRNLIQPVRHELDANPQEFSGGNEAALRDLLSRIYVQVVESKKARALIRLLIAESEKFPELAQIYHQEIIAPGASAIAFIVERGVASGEFRATDVRRFPQILVAPAILAVVWILLFGKRHALDLNSYRKAHLDFVMRGLYGAISAKSSSEEEFMPSRGAS